MSIARGWQVVAVELRAVCSNCVSRPGNLDLSTPSGRLMFQIIGAMAEFERALIQERVRGGLKAARARGQQLGRPRRVTNGNRIEKMRADGMSIREIADKLGVGYGTVRMRLGTGERKTPHPKVAKRD